MAMGWQSVTSALVSLKSLSTVSGGSKTIIKSIAFAPLNLSIYNSRRVTPKSHLIASVINPPLLLDVHVFSPTVLLDQDTLWSLSHATI